MTNEEQKELVEKQLYYFLKEWLSMQQKKKIVDKLYDNERKFLFLIIMSLNISNEELENEKKNTLYVVVYKFLTRAMNGDIRALNILPKIFYRNVKKEKRLLSEQLQSYKYDNLPNSKKQSIDKIIREGKYEICENIIDQYYKNNSTITKVKEAVFSYQAELDMIDINCLTSEILKANEHIIEHLCCVICHPLSATSYNGNIFLDKNAVPCEWYFNRILSIAEFKDIHNLLNDKEKWNKFYNDCVNRLTEKCNVPIPQIYKRKHMIFDIISNLNEKRFDSALILLFATIEGFLRDMVMLINIEQKIYLKDGTIYDCINHKKFKSNKIRDLLEKTYVKEYLDNDFLKYFCNELYAERNPVLHGNNICYECKEKSICIIKKLFSLEYVVDRLIDIIKERTFKVFDINISDERVDTFLANALEKINRND